MATIEICDICGTCDNVNRRYYAYDRLADRARGREDINELFDLCETHELIVLKKAMTVAMKNRIENNGYELNRLIIKEIKEMISRRHV